MAHSGGVGSGAHIFQTTAALVVPLVVGGLVGLFLVRLFLLNPVEEAAWMLFWDSLGTGDGFAVGEVLSSTTFWKCFVGFAIGAGAGGTWGWKLGKDVDAKFRGYRQ